MFLENLFLMINKSLCTDFQLTSIPGRLNTQAVNPEIFLLNNSIQGHQLGSSDFFLALQKHRHSNLT